MDMTEKNGQPSMEEILASIRRIIAEEPADSISLDFKPRSGLGPGNGAEHLSLDDASDFELPSMFRAATPQAEKANGGVVKLMDALRATPQLDAQASSRAQPDFPLPATPLTSGALSSATVGSGITNGHEAAPRVSNWSDPNPTLHQALSSLRPAARPDLQASDVNGHGAAPFVMPAVEVVAADAQNNSTWGSEPPRAEPEAQTQAIESASVVRQMAPFRDQHFARMRGGQSDPPPPAALDTAFNDQPPAVIFNVTEFVAPQPPQATAIFAPPVASSPPPLNGADLTAATAVPPALPPAVQLPLEAAPAGGIEDATAELLRPMLRQWLSDNMPRMVEKALHIEVAESVKPGKKPGI